MMNTAWIVLATIVGYFILLFIISWLASRKTDTSTALTGGRQAPWFIVAIAMIGAPISGVTFISVPGYVVGSSYSYMQMVLGFAVGYFVIAYVLMPMFFKRNLVSIYGYLEDRFGVSTHKTGAWFFFISKMLGAAVRFLVVCVTLQMLVFEPLHIPFIFNVIATIALIFLYTLQGGVKTVIWTDTLKYPVGGALHRVYSSSARIWSRRHGESHRCRRLVAHLLLRQSQGGHLFLETVYCRHLHGHCHDRS